MEVGGILLRLRLDTSQINRNINDCVKNARGNLVGGFNQTSDSVQKAIQRINAAIESNTNKLRRQETAMMAQRNTISNLSTALEQAREKYRQQTEEIERQEETVRQLEEQYAQMQNRTEQPTRESQKEMQKLSKKLEDARKALNRLNQSAETSQNRINHLSGNLDTANRRLGDMQEETDQTRRHIQELNEELQNVELDNIQEQVPEVEEGMSRISAVLKKVGVLLASAFAVGKLISFGKSCIELGSDLQEVQNVVDVTFPSMSKQVDEFAQNAAASFGLSETMAKKFTGTFGAMAKAFGFSESAAYEMSTTLTGLAGDVASFYNLSQDEAYTKLKSVFTGETETLKDLGIVMTQSALDSYALANGFGKTTAKMTEAEKVALRYQFVQEQLTLASGDFLRTSDGWANQVRVLQLQFDSLKATIGQGLINVLTPVIKVINTLVGKLMTLANAFKAFTEFISGGKKEDNTAGMKAVAEAAKDAASSTQSIGDAAASSAKKAKGVTAAFDKLNVLNHSEGSGGGAGGASSDYSADTFETGEYDPTPVEEMSEGFLKLIERAKELGKLFQKGFQVGLGDTSVFESILTSLQTIKESFQNIFQSPKVTQAAGNFVNTLVENLGLAAGSAVSIGASITDNLLGGISLYLEEHTPRIQEYFVSIFDIGSRIVEIGGGLSEAFGTIFESFRSDGAKRCTSSVIGIFSEGFMGITEMLATVGTDVADMLLSPLIENSDLIRQSLEGTFEAVAPILEEVESLLEEGFSKTKETYEQFIKPTLDDIKEGLTALGAKALELYQAYILPAITRVSEKFSEFKKNYLEPLIEKFQKFSEKVWTAIDNLWVNCIQPFAAWFMENLYPGIAKAIDLVSDVFFSLAEGVSEVIGGILDWLGGVITFLTGVFTGDWEMAWQGVQDCFSGIWEMIKGIFDGILNAIWDIIRWFLNNAKDFFSKTWEGIKKKVADVLLSLLDKIDNIFPGMKNIILKVLTSIKTVVSNVFQTIYNSIHSVLTRLKTFWNNLWDGLKATVVTVFDGIWSAIKGVINSILGGIESMANGIVRGLNKAIQALNTISFEVPDWVPVIGGMSFGFNVPEIPEVSLPRLAQGGYVKPNTPQLAMIGDNRHQGEIVAPEDKMYEVSYQAMMDVMKQFVSLLSAAKREPQGNRPIVLKVTGEMSSLVRFLKIELEKEAGRTGQNFEVVIEG